MISIKSLSFKFDNNMILDDINLDIEKGKIYSIIGPNGSGKTTLLKLIANILGSKKETIYIECMDLNDIKINQLAKKLAVVPQNTDIGYQFNVIDIVAMGRIPYLNRFQSMSKEDKQIIKDAMCMTNTWDLRDKKIGEISGGERQRVIVAKAITQQTDILLLDEPISHLDIHHQIELLELMRKLNKSGLTIIAVLHDINLASLYSDYLILLYNKSIYDIGTPEKVITKDSIKKIYNMDVHLTQYPDKKKPVIMPKIK